MPPCARGFHDPAWAQAEPLDIRNNPIQYITVHLRERQPELPHTPAHRTPHQPALTSHSYSHHHMHVPSPLTHSHLITAYLPLAQNSRTLTLTTPDLSSHSMHPQHITPALAAVP